MTALVKPLKRGPKPRKRLKRAAAPICRRARPRQRGGSIRAKFNRVADPLWGRAVAMRAAGACERGQTMETWHVGCDPHHVLGKKAHPELRHVVENGIWLCRRHHEAAHRRPVAFRAWFARVRPEDFAAISERRAA